MYMLIHPLNEVFLPMLRMKRFCLYSRDGRYLGEYRAFAPETAFCEYMSLMGKRVVENEVTFTPLDEGMDKLTYQANEYFVFPMQGRERAYHA